jgi:cytochrome c nitrite reductase small subunit
MTKIPVFVAVAALLVVLGIGMYVTDFTAYLGNNPATCNNCHVMDATYENWFHAPHERWAKCSDCHLPHENVFAYYYIKGKSGMHDVYVFSTGKTPVMIRANEETQEIIQENCIRCHEATVEGVVGEPMPTDRYCFECHRSVAHGERGISLLPYQDTGK